MDYISEPLSSLHEKAKFVCGKEMLDNYLHTQANQDVKRKLSTCFVVKHEDNNLIKGYYTLSNNSIDQDLIPHNLKKKIPRSYGDVPTILLGRLAIDITFQGQRLGVRILLDALKRSYDVSKSIGSFAVVVDPIDSESEKFYEKYDFIKLPNSGKMFLPMQEVGKLFQSSN